MANNVINKKSFVPPYQSQIIDQAGLLTRVWEQFFRKMSEVLTFIGDESPPFPLVNNQIVAANITGLVFDLKFTSSVVIDYLIQRTTSTTEKVQSGILMAVYRPKTLTWALIEYGTPGPDVSGITFSITSAGQIQYTSSNLGGTQVLSRIIYRTRELAAKSSLYSKVG